MHRTGAQVGRTVARARMQLRAHPSAGRHDRNDAVDELSIKKKGEAFA